MRRLARHLFTLCSAVSLLLCVAVCVLWGRSYRTWDRVQQYRLEPGKANEMHALGTGPGSINYGRVHLDEPSKQRWPRTSTP